MDTVSLYVTTCRYVMRSDPNDPSTYSELYRYVPFLRQALLCYVCGGILQRPMGPVEKVCQHNVCNDCVGGKMRLKPQCSWCKDHKAFIEKPQLRIVVQLFKKLCEYILSTPLAEKIAAGSVNGESNSLLQIMQEAVDFRDDLYSNGESQKKLKENGPPKLTKINNNKPSKSHLTQRGRKPSSQQSQSAQPPSPSLSSPTADSTIVAPTNDTNSVNTAEQTVTSSSTLCEGVVLSGSPLQQDALATVTSAGPAEGQAATSNHHYSVTLTNHDTPRLKLKRKYPTDDHSSMIKKYKPDSAITSGNKKTSSKNQNADAKKKGCRCGNATPTPGKLTCYGQRCPCYVQRVACTECRCRGCRNPVKPIKVEISENLEVEEEEISVV
ncbi:E3 ubiquitin-protein ligase MSL2-like [Lingula anatina]|uniref:E3 ubiquitin-protein ligase MSL2-like n=1 Tax=Lingula anatina TaxID=7574 RepID=A0A1S3K9A7_LINAN|nr:E3 ubiquitin-protein ligase MSL2-like [Lingula anatina]|eukprot:XP_013419077.1 E3 ubiquitin-protein ligase MSL2-like [Lingula anatina]